MEDIRISFIPTEQPYKNSDYKVIGIVISKNKGNMVTFDMYNETTDSHKYIIFCGVQSFIYDIDPKKSEDYVYIDDINVIKALVRTHNNIVAPIFKEHQDMFKNYAFYPIKGIATKHINGIGINMSSLELLTSKL